MQRHVDVVHVFCGHVSPNVDCISSPDHRGVSNRYSSVV